ncbi:putative Magnetosome protein MamS [Gammaproteobacteria bacterium]
MKKPILVINGISIVVVGMLFMMGLLVIALLFPEQFSSLPASSVNLQAQPMVNTPVVGMPVRMIPAATVQPAPGNAVGKGLTSLQKRPQVNFQGVVQQITEQPQSDGQLHVWLKSSGVDQRVSVGPGWFLQYLGCPLQHDITVSGSGFIFQQEVGSNLIYAKKIVLNGKTCQLRNDEGFALWSNKLR